MIMPALAAIICLFVRIRIRVGSLRNHFAVNRKEARQLSSDSGSSFTVKYVFLHIFRILLSQGELNNASFPKLYSLYEQVSG